MSSPSTPGQSAIVAMKELHKDVVFKVPTSVKKKRAQKVLDDEQFVEEMGKIIEHDFFPDLEKLKAKMEYMEAVEKNDVIKIRELHQKYTGSKEIPSRLPSPATFETPANIHGSQERPASPAQTEASKVEVASDTTRRLSLDQYLSAHTSEDNQSFEGIMAEAERKHAAKYAYLYREEGEAAREHEEALTLPSVEQQAALPERKLNVDTWTYTNRNFIMYAPEGVALTPAEELEHAQRRREVVHANTRLALHPFDEGQSAEAISALARRQARRGLDGKIGVDGKELVATAATTGPGGMTPHVRGFGLVRTPSPAHVVIAAASPLMTWGVVEGTPFRLDGGDTPLTRTPGPSFKICAPPRREQLAFALAEKASERHRDKKRKAMDAARRQFQSPSPYTGSSRERLFSMSPAAQRLATTRLRLGETIAHSPSSTPRLAAAMTTPSRRAPTPNKTPKLQLGIRKSSNAATQLDNTLTDDLLKIQLPRRQTASDFF